MFSSAASLVRSSFSGLILVAAVSCLQPGALGQETKEHQSGHAQPAELRVFDPSLIDKGVDPCENFYQYSCNGWFKRNPLPPDQAAYGRFTELYELNRLHLRQILESAASTQADSRSPNEQKIGDAYATCMDTAAINKRGLK